MSNVIYIANIKAEICVKSSSFLNLFPVECSQSDYIGDALLSNLEVGGGMVREVVRGAALDEPAPDDVVLGRVLVPLEHDPRRHGLEQVLAEQGLGLGSRKVPHSLLPVLAGLVLDELSLACLHVVDEGHCDPILSCYPLEGHHHRCDGLPSLREALVTASDVLAEGVHDDELEAWELLDDLFELLVKQVLVALVKNSHIVDARENLLDGKLVLVLLEKGWILVDVLQHLAPQTLRHLGDSLGRKVTVSVHIESVALHAAEDLRDLHVEAQLEANLSLASGAEATDLCHLAEAEDHVEEVVLRVVCLHSPHIDDLLHQEDELSLPLPRQLRTHLDRGGLRGGRLSDTAQGEVEGLLAEKVGVDLLDSGHLLSQVALLLLRKLRVCKQILR